MRKDACRTSETLELADRLCCAPASVKQKKNRPQGKCTSRAVCLPFCDSDGGPDIQTIVGGIDVNERYAAAGGMRGATQRMAHKSRPLPENAEAIGGRVARARAENKRTGAAGDQTTDTHAAQGCPTS